MRARLLSLALLAVLAAACRDQAGAATVDASSAEGGAIVTDADLPGDADLPVDADAPDAEPAGPRIYATALVTPVLSETEWPARDPEHASDERKNVVRLGYLRKGSSARVKSETPLKKPNCTDGWWELADGGFVCGKMATTDPKNPALEDAPHAPFTDRPLPYDYGMSMGTGTPLYYRIPTRSEREKIESTIPVSKPTSKKKGKEKDEAKAPAPAATLGEDNPYAGVKPDADDTPWFLKQQTGERPKVSLEDLAKGGGGLLERRMVKGFYVALDKELGIRRRRQGPEKFWRTTHGLIAPYEHILVHEAKEDMKGVWLDKPDSTFRLPLGFVIGGHAHKWKLDIPEGAVHDPKLRTIPGAKARRQEEKVERFTIVNLTGKSFEIDKRSYFELADGAGYLRDLDITTTKPGPRPADVKPDEKWIDVNVTTQSLVAFVGDKPAYATLVSSGRHDDEDKTQDHRTPKGDFRIREKHVAATMEQDTATDGPYSIQDVPWIQYFHGGYALHGAFWHSRFGHERSHGCVNLAPIDARELFGWTGPRLPPGWHGVKATDANPGTRVIVHDSESLEKPPAR
jgi:hypothetical protein